METATKQSPWNASMTESQTQELVRKYFCDREFHHAHLGDAYIRGYENYLDSHPAVFAIWFEHCPGTTYVTLEEFFGDEFCIQACEDDLEEIARIFGPYVDNWIAREEAEKRKCCEELLITLEELQQTRGCKRTRPLVLLTQYFQSVRC